MYSIGIDIGGTFTDGVLIDEKGKVINAKVLNTPDNLARGVILLLEKLSKILNKDVYELVSQTNRIVHGTTISTNAIITGSGAKTGMITTENFRDIIEMRRGIRWAPFNNKIECPMMLVPRYLRIGVPERYDWEGNELIPLNEDAVRNAASFFKDEGVESIAICFLWSFLYPDHERRAKEIVKDEYPEVYVTTSSEIIPIIREFERFSTTVISAYVGPIVRKYLEELNKSLNEMGFRGEFLIQTSAGGVQTVGGVQSIETAILKAVITIGSGPASGPPAGIYFGNIAGSKDIVTFDMGGTSLDVCLIKDNIIPSTTESWVAGTRGVTGHRCAIKMVDVHSVGAGGGSIAWIDPAGILRVGPRSAGAYPGPACYGLGGEYPTVTDANLLLGYLSPDYFLGGEIRLNAEAAERAMKKIAKPLDMDIYKTAYSIHELANHAMVGALSSISVERGYDPRDFVIVVGGGAGGTHVARVAGEMNINKVIIPKIAPQFCAFGMLNADIRHDFVQSYWVPQHKWNFDEVKGFLERMKKEGISYLEKEGVRKEDMYFIISADMRYIGQFHEVEVIIPEEDINEEILFKKLPEEFHVKHAALYTYSAPHRPIEMLNLRVVALGRTPKPKLEEMEFTREDIKSALKGRRKVYLKEYSDFSEVDVYNGERLKNGHVVKGPAIIEEIATTLLVPPGYKFEIDKFGSYIGGVA
jgi:N-methylhydantoinase A